MEKDRLFYCYYMVYHKKLIAERSMRPQACNFIKKETLAQVFSCEFCEISKNIFSYRTPLVAASELNVTKILLRYPLDLEVSKKAPKCFKEHEQSKCHTAAQLTKQLYLNVHILQKCTIPTSLNRKQKSISMRKLQWKLFRIWGNKDYQLEQITSVLTISRSYCYCLANTIDSILKDFIEICFGTFQFSRNEEIHSNWTKNEVFH